jgi:hypothetical protein
MSETVTVTIISGFGGTVTPNDTVEVIVGQQCKFTATPYRTCSFLQWIFNGTARNWTANPLTLTITEAGNYTLEAQFTGPQLPIVESGQGSIHVNIAKKDEGITHEVIVCYPEGSPEFE